MTPFLNIVARDLMEKLRSDFSNVTIVFPNKRASLFFNKALQEITERPLWAPEYTTISEFFQQQSRLMIADPIKLICELYESYRGITHADESLDQFYQWGELMLSDFDDIDKHLADTTKVFTLLGNLHEMDSVDYLLPEQRAILMQFFKNFTEEHSTMLKERFLKLWNKFQDIYQDYHNRLEAQGIAYEGMLYRQVVENLNKNLPQDTRTYVFIGFNLLNTVEQEIFFYYKKAGRAMFYWDYDAYYMKPGEEAGSFIGKYLRDFPNELPYDHPTYSNIVSSNTEKSKCKSVAVTSSPTEDLQARYVSEWLTPERIRAGRKTAIVLADEKLLDTVLHCLPPQVQHVNITTGYPLGQTAIATLVHLTTSLYDGFRRSGRQSFTLHAINPILRHKFMQLISQNAAKLYNTLNKASIYYPSLEDLSLDENLTMFFTPLKNSNDCTEVNDRLMWMVSTIAKSTVALSEKEGDPLTQESLYRMYTILNRLANLDLKELTTTLYSRLLQQIIQTTTIPFHGEPIEGIQIMGVLETRNLDFEHILVLSCNEGNLPKNVNDSSFIPHSVRQAYGLTTVENKVAIYAYYFHRILQRATDIHLIYNSSTNDGHTGEMSRFILQLLAESPLHITRYALEAGQETHSHTSIEVEKTSDIIRKLTTAKDNKSLPYFSPTMLGTYLRCPMRFFYRYIAEISDKTDSDEEEMDNVAFGNIFHRTAELIYKDLKGRTITKTYLTDLLRDATTIEHLVNQAFREELFRLKESNRPTPKLGGLQVINREMVIKFIHQLLQYDITNTPFTLIGTEEGAYGTITVNFKGKPLDVTIGGKIDRLDKVMTENSEHIRIIDYKTGRLTGGKPLTMTSLDDIFSEEKMPHHADYFIQALLYSSIIAGHSDSCNPPKESLPITPLILFIQNLRNEEYTPLLYLDKHPIHDASILLGDYHAHIRTLIEHIIDPDIPFNKTADHTQCERCPYSRLCY